MKRLRDCGGEPLRERARELRRAVEPPPESPARMQRIRAAVEARAREPSRRVRGTVAWSVAACLLAGGATAAGGVAWQRMRATPPVDGAAAPPAAPPSSPPRVAAGVATKPAVEPAPAVSASAVLAPVAAPARGVAGARAPAPEASAHSADAALVHAAVKALRRDGDPEQAARLLERYAARDPDGPLAEEALALRIEAAVARHEPRARALAQEYLGRYPAGRYRAAAQRALAEPARP